VGYNDDDPDNAYWIMVNSWGTADGGRPNGTFRLDMNMNYDCYFYYPFPRGYYSFYWQTLDITFFLWESYKGNHYDSGGTQEDIFNEYPSENIVYMYGTGFEPGTNYRVIFWDAGGANAGTEDTSSDSDGNLSAAHTFTQTDTAGDWHCAVYDSQSYNPGGYSASDSHIVADDTSYTGGVAFHVENSAIPEFPTVAAAVTSLTLCAGVYLWRRRRSARIHN